MPTFDSLAATDEDVLIECAGDYFALVPAHQRVVAGTDATIAPGSFTLTSATDMAARGLSPGCVVVIRPGDPRQQDIGVVGSVAATAATLRRAGLAAGEGQPFGGSAGVAAVSFAAPTCHPQLRAATRRLADRYPGSPAASPGFNEAAVLMALIDLYGALFRAGASPIGGGSDRDNFAAKYQQYRAELAEVLARLDGVIGTAATGTATVSVGVIPTLSSLVPGPCDGIG